MGTISKERLFGAAIEAAEQRAREARRVADVAACEAWNIRMKGYGGPAQPSPLLGDALNAGYRYLAGGKGGEQKQQAVGRSRGGPNTKIHALADAKGRLIAILLTGGEAHDYPVTERLIRRVKPSKRMLGDKAYDSAELRDELDERGTKPVIPNRSNRKQPYSFSKRLYKLRWRIESAFNRLKDFRRIATRYDRLARNYLASVCLAAALVWWI